MSQIIILDDLLHLLLEILYALIPLVLVFIFFQVFVFKLGRSSVLNIIKGIVLTYVGLVLFLYGVKIGFLPTGKIIGESLGNSPNNWVLVPIGFLLGFVVTFVEPAIRVLCIEVEKSSSGFVREKTILYTLSAGVAVSVALAMAKTVYGISLAYLLIPGYFIAFVLAIITGPDFTGIAFDSGGVATGPMVVTFIMSISIGVADVMSDRDAVIDGFGLVSLVALAPIISVLLLGLAYRIKAGMQNGNDIKYKGMPKRLAMSLKTGILNTFNINSKESGEGEDNGE
ncbi:MAG: DUF1538 domain-containing protein [Actinobacteria bacterium]|nr:DUF1538 domain-containing protein [Actinomycetota bacterium]